MIERPNADRLLSGELGQWLALQNAERDAVKAKAAKVRKIGIAVACLVALALLFASDWNVWIALQFGFFTGLAGFGIAELIKRPMLDRLKSGINGAVAKALGLENSVQVEPGEAFARAKSFELVPPHDNARFQDLWWGSVGGRPFTLHEARLTEQRGSGKNRRTETVFEGSILAIGFARRFNGTTVIEPHGERRKFLVGGEKDSTEIGGQAVERIDLTDPRFEERFTVWSNDQVEGRYLVHPAYVERLLAVETAFSGKEIRALFHEGDLLVTLKTGDLFESGSLDASDDRALLEKTIGQFTALADLATQLNERERLTFADLPDPSSSGP